MAERRRTYQSNIEIPSIVDARVFYLTGSGASGLNISNESIRPLSQVRTHDFFGIWQQRFSSSISNNIFVLDLNVPAGMDIQIEAGQVLNQIPGTSRLTSLSDEDMAYVMEAFSDINNPIRSADRVIERGLLRPIYREFTTIPAVINLSQARNGADRYFALFRSEGWFNFTTNVGDRVNRLHFLNKILLNGQPVEWT